MNKHIGLNMTSDTIRETTQDLPRATWRDYIHVTKPRIIMSNLIAAFGGFWVASKWDVQWLLLIQVLIGTALVMASACTLNNHYDRDLDRKMERTKNRPLATGRLDPRMVFWYGIVLGIIGLTILYSINTLTFLLGLIGSLVYVVIYTYWLKRTSTWSTSVGAISGAMPPVIGYCAVTGTMDIGAWILFFLLFLWQPPHFWALGIRRIEEYRHAGFPLLPVVKGIRRTKFQMIPYVVLLVVSSILLYVYGYAGIFYLITASILGAIWLIYCIIGIITKDDQPWARKVFMFSVNYLTILFIVMIVNTPA